MHLVMGFALAMDVQTLDLYVLPKIVSDDPSKHLLHSMRILFRSCSLASAPDVSAVSCVTAGKVRNL
jgi:hypothetical protein